MQPQCSFDNKPITGRYYEDYWGNCICRDHFRKAILCPYCGRFITPATTGGGTTFSDGQAICGICYKKAVTKETEGKRILSGVYEILENYGIRIGPIVPDFYLINRRKLRELDKTGWEKQGTALFKRSIRNGRIERFEMKVFILQGLPRISFYSACAHELMHIWFYSRGITDASLPLIEGSCNLASYLIHNLFSDMSRIYGKGFQKMYGIYSSEGLTSWLGYIKKRKK